MHERIDSHRREKGNKYKPSYVCTYVYIKHYAQHDMCKNFEIVQIVKRSKSKQYSKIKSEFSRVESRIEMRWHTLHHDW